MTHIQQLEPVAVASGGGEAVVVQRPSRHKGDRGRYGRPDDDPRDHRTRQQRSASPRSPPGGRGFWILEGSATFEVGQEKIEAGVGDYLFGPRDIPHRYTTGPDGCRMLFIFTPGGFEDLLTAISRPAQTRTLPPPDNPPPSDEEMQAMQAAIEAHGCELLG